MQIILPRRKRLAPRAYNRSVYGGTDDNPYKQYEVEYSVSLFQTKETLHCMERVVLNIPMFVKIEYPHELINSKFYLDSPYFNSPQIPEIEAKALAEAFQTHVLKRDDIEFVYYMVHIRLAVVNGTPEKRKTKNHTSISTHTDGFRAMYTDSRGNHSYWYRVEQDRVALTLKTTSPIRIEKFFDEIRKR